jgi:hypothetical protein
VPVWLVLSGKCARSLRRPLKLNQTGPRLDYNFSSKRHAPPSYAAGTWAVPRLRSSCGCEASNKKAEVVNHPVPERRFEVHGEKRYQLEARKRQQDHNALLASRSSQVGRMVQIHSRANPRPADQVQYRHSGGSFPRV